MHEFFAMSFLYLLKCTRERIKFFLFFTRLIIPLTLLASSTQASSLYVFLPTEIRAKVLENKIKNSCPGVNVTVFGRGKDFRKQVQEMPPTGILSLSPVIDSTDNFSISLHGKRQGISKESYFLVSVDQILEKESIPNSKLGVVDLLGRKPMTEYVSQLFGFDVKIKRVTKIEDLLPLLTFKAVDAIFISESVYKSIKEKTQLDLKVNNINIQLGLASTAVGDPALKDSLNQCIQKFDQALNTTLGVDQWESSI